MNKQRPILIIILLAYIFLPSLLHWVVNEEGHWYRPFLVWLAAIIAAFLFQVRRKAS